MAPGDVCHGPRCSLAGLGPVALEYRSCHWPGGSAVSPQCVRPMGCWFFPVPRPPYVCAVSWAAWLLFTGVSARFVVLRLRCPGPLGSCSPVCSLGVLCCVCGVLGHLAPVHRCARSVCCVACAVSRATWLLFTGAPARCVALRVRCPGPLGSRSPVCPLGVLCRVCGVMGHLAPVHRCARSVCCFACAVSWVTWLLFTVVPARCVVLRVRCPGPLGSCSPVRPLGVSLCVLAASVVSAHPTLRLSLCVGATNGGFLKSTTTTVSRHTPQFFISSSCPTISVVLTPCGCRFLASLLWGSSPPSGGVHAFGGGGTCSNGQLFLRHLHPYQHLFFLLSSFELSFLTHRCIRPNHACISPMVMSCPPHHTRNNLPRYFFRSCVP